MFHEGVNYQSEIQKKDLEYTVKCTVHANESKIRA